MKTKSRYQREILEELKDLPAAKLSTLLKLVRLWKQELFGRSQKKTKANALLDVDALAVKTGVTDLAEHHDHYLYGLEKHG
jgi:hypothetical protein